MDIKRYILLPLILFFTHCTGDTTQLSKEERDFAIAQLNASKTTLLHAIEGLYEEQLHYKSDDASWSISECVEHITLFVDDVFEIVEESLELPANPERRKDVKFSDEELMTFIEDRSNATTTQEDYEPKNRYGGHIETTKAYQKSLERHIEYLQNTKDDLRNHYVNFGTVDTYQIFLYMAAHTNRHVAQINTIKKSIHFPKP